MKTDNEHKILKVQALHCPNSKVLNGAVASPCAASWPALGGLALGICLALANTHAGHAQQAPGVTISVPQVVRSNPRNQGPLTWTSKAFTVTITFSEAVTGFTIDDIQVTGSANAQKSDFTSVTSSQYTVLITPEEPLGLFNLGGIVTIQVPAGVAQNLNGVGNVAGQELRVTYETMGPTVTLTSDPSTLPPCDPNNLNPFTIEIEFSEYVNNFEEQDIVVFNAMLSNFLVVTPTEETELHGPGGAEAKEPLKKPGSDISRLFTSPVATGFLKCQITAKGTCSEFP